MVRIRLKRMGTKHKPFYRVVVAPTKAMRDGAFVDEIGVYDPIKEPTVLKIDREKALRYLVTGAQVSDTVLRLLKKEGIWEEFEGGKPAKKARRKPVKPRVKKAKPEPKPKKVKLAPVAEEAESAAESTETTESAEEVTPTEES